MKLQKSWAVGAQDQLPLSEGRLKGTRLKHCSWGLEWGSLLVKGDQTKRSAASAILLLVQFSQFSCSVISNSLQPHGLQHTRFHCPSPIPRACSNSCPLSRWCHPTISSSVAPFSSHLQSFPASGSFLVNQFSGGQSTGASASASVLPMNIQD